MQISVRFDVCFGKIVDNQSFISKHILYFMRTPASFSHRSRSIRGRESIRRRENMEVQKPSKFIEEIGKEIEQISGEKLHFPQNCMVKFDQT